MIPFNPLPLLAWWREILIGLLVLAIGVQTYRLNSTQGERNLLALEKTERARRDAMRDATNLRNKERTDEEYAAARGRAAAVVVRDEGPGIKPRTVAVAGFGDEPTVCFNRGRLVEELAGWVLRDDARIERLSAGIRERSSGVAQAGEGVAAAYRACRAFTLSVQ